MTVRLMEGLDAGLLRRATASVKCEDSTPEAGMNEEATFMLASVYERCSKGKLKVLGMFQVALAAIPGTGCARTGRNNVPEN